MSKSTLGNDPFKAVGISAPDKKDQAKPKSKKASKKTSPKPKKKNDKGSSSKKTKPKQTAKKPAKPTAPKKTETKVDKKPEKHTLSKTSLKKVTTEKKSLQKSRPNKTVAPQDEKKERVTPPASQEETKAAKESRVLVPEGDLHNLFRASGLTVDDDFGFDPEFAAKMEPLIEFFYRYYWRVSVSGIENIPQTGRAVLVANHAGILPFDAMMVSSAIQRGTDRKVSPLVENMFYHMPILGTILSRLGFVRACQENAQRLLAEDRMVLVFPEGVKGVVKPYNRRYSLQRFGRGGFVKLCLVADAPVVPVSIVGSEEVHPIMANLSGLAKSLNLPFLPITPLFPWLGPFGLAPLPAKWSIVFGEPIYINQFGPEAASDRVVVNRLAGKVKSQIQKMIDFQIGQRGSRWRG